MLDTRQYFNDLYPIIAKRFNLKVDAGEKIISTLIGVKDSKTIDYRIDNMGEIGEIPKYNGTTVTNLDQKRGYTTIITPEERTAKSSVTLKYKNVDMSGEAGKIGDKLGMSMRATIYNDFLRLFQRATDTAYPIGDGSAWASTTHRNTSDANDTSTYSNLITSTFAPAGIDTAMKLGARYVTSSGLPTGINYDCVLVAPELAQKAAEYFGLNNQLTPEMVLDSAENNANPYSKMKYFVVGGGALGFTAKQWALASTEMLKETVNLVYINRPRIDMLQETPYVMNYYVYSDYNFGASEGRSIIFSNPA